MITQLRTSFTTGRRVHLAIGAAAALVALASAPAANAGTGPAERAAAASTAGGQGESAFTMTVMKPSSGVQGLALGVDEAGRLRLQRAAIGDAGQQWTVLGDPLGSPTAPPVPLHSFATCIQQVRCAFTQPAPSTMHRFVNRGNGRCLTLIRPEAGPVRLTTTDCTSVLGDRSTQRLHWNFSDAEVESSGVPQRYTALGGNIDGRLRCATVPASSHEVGAGLVGAACDNRLRWQGQFRFTPVG